LLVVAGIILITTGLNRQNKNASKTHG